MTIKNDTRGTHLDNSPFSQDYDHQLQWKIPAVTSSMVVDAIEELTPRMSRSRAQLFCGLIAQLRCNLPVALTKFNIDDHSAVQFGQHVLDHAMIHLSSPFKLSCRDLIRAVKLQDDTPANFAIMLLSNHMLTALSQILEGAASLVIDFLDDDTVTPNCVIDFVLNKVEEVATDNSSKFSVMPMFANETVEQLVIEFVANHQG